jgi:hypothetical protein
MKIVLASFVLGSLVVGTALAQTSATSQSSAAASNDASVSAGNSGAQASSRHLDEGGERQHHQARPPGRRSGQLAVWNYRRC